MTITQVRNAGYKQSPVRSHIIFCCKYDVVTGAFKSPKARWVVEGTTQQCKFGVHWFESFSHASNPVATRLMQAIAVGEDKKRHAGDIKTAFLHSRLQPHEIIPIRLPPGMEVMVDGQLCEYVLALRGQYGMPSAAFYWTRELNRWLMATFNSDSQVESQPASESASGSSQPASESASVDSDLSP